MLLPLHWALGRRLSNRLRPIIRTARRLTPVGRRHWYQAYHHRLLQCLPVLQAILQVRPRLVLVSRLGVAQDLVSVGVRVVIPGREQALAVWGRPAVLSALVRT